MLKNRSNTIIKIVIYTVCILLAILSIAPFYIMIVNSTRSTVEILIASFQICLEKPGDPDGKEL